MADLIYVAGTLVLFAVSVLFVFALDKIVGKDEDVLAEEGPDAAEVEPVRERRAA